MPSGVNESIKWSMLELRGLVEDEDVRVYYQRAQRHLGLYPFHLNDLNTAIREMLSSTINCYDNELQGLVLVYKNPKLLTALGAILHDSHFIHVDVLADFYVFKPEIGCTLKGIINKKAENHVGVLVHKAFNVSIPKPEESEEWLGDFVYVGQEVKFTVTHLDFKGKLPFIRGILLADGIDMPSCDDPVGSANDKELDEKLGQWQDPGTTEIVSETAKKRSKKHSAAVNSSSDDSSDSDNKLDVFKRKEEKNRKVKKGISANPRIDDESSTDGTEEHALNSVSTEDRCASNDKRNRQNSRDRSQNNTDIDEKSKISPPKKSRDSSSRDTVDIDEKPKISPLKKRRDSSSRDTVDIDEKPKISPRKKRRDSSSRDTVDIDEKPKISPRKKHRDSSSRDTVDIDEKPKISPLKKHRDSSSRDTVDIDEKPKISPRKKLRDSNLSDTIDIDVKPKISSRKASKEKRTNGECDAMGEETVSKTETRDRKNRTSTGSVEKKQSDERNTATIDVPSKSEISENGLQDKKTVDSYEDRAGSVESPKKHSKKNKILDRETEEASEFETKPSVRVKKKKKKTKVENDEEQVEEPESLQSNGRDFEFVKPDIDTCVPSKSKRKRHRDVDGNGEEASESSMNDSEFFRDVRIKVEPDTSDIEAAVSERSSGKPKKKRAKIELESGDESFRATRIKTEPNASDIEDTRPSKKKSKKRRSNEDSMNGIKIKVEPNASDVEGSVVPKSRLKSEPHGFNIKVDQEHDDV